MKRLLPIGTILMLDVESKEKVMIIGRLVRKSEETKEVWDYCGWRIKILEPRRCKETSDYRISGWGRDNVFIISN